MTLPLILVGFAGIYKESKLTLEIYICVAAILGLAALAQAIVSTYYSFTFDSYYGNNWNEIMKQIHYRYFDQNSMHCYLGKYLQNSTSFYDLKCDSKQEIAYIWENQTQKDLADQET